MKKRFPRLPIIITADGLYVSQKVIQPCTDYGWDYIIRYKEGCAPSIAKEYKALPEKRKRRFGNRVSEPDYVSKFRYKSDILYRKEKPVRWKRKNNRVSMDYKYYNYKKQCQKNSKSREKQMENRESGF